MCPFAGALPLLGEIGEAGGFARGSSRHGHPAVGGELLVEETGYGKHQSSAGNFQLRRSYRSRSSSPRDRQGLGQSQRLIHHCLAGIFVNRIVGDKDRERLGSNRGSLGVDAIRLGVQVLVVKRSIGQQSGARYGVIQCGDTCVGGRSGEGGLVSTSQSDGLLQSYRSRWGGVDLLREPGGQ